MSQTLRHTISTSSKKLSDVVHAGAIIGLHAYAFANGVWCDTSGDPIFSNGWCRVRINATVVEALVDGEWIEAHHEDGVDFAGAVKVEFHNAEPAGDCYQRGN